MKAYLDIIQNILDYGYRKSNRTGIDTLALPFMSIRHDMEDGYPLLTTRKMPIKSMAVELEGFIHGITSKAWFQNRGCKWWDFWCNPQKIPNYVDDNGRFIKETDDILAETRLLTGMYRKITPEEIKLAQQQEDDLGTIYSHSWRRFGEAYDENDNGVINGVDQFKYIVNTLKSNPFDRRMVCVAFNPLQLSRCALPACHSFFNVVVTDRLNLGFHMRSVDMALGCPNNIASYALLLLLLAKESGFKPGILYATFADCHIYINQINGLKEQLMRTPKELPIIDILNWKNIWEWTHEDIRLNNYIYYPKLSFGDIAV